jgi:hypothetical protein
MKQLTKSSFHYYGNRPYVNAIHLFECFLGQVIGELPEACRPQSIRSFKVFNEITKDGSWWLVDASQDLSEGVHNPTATLRFVDMSGAKRRIDFVDDGAAVVRREGNPADRFVNLECDGQFSGSARLPEIASPAAFFEGLIQINKAIHLETLRRAGGTGGAIRYIYMENLSLREFDDAASRDFLLKFSHLGTRSGEDRTYTLCRITNELAQEQAPITMCYSYAPNEDP